MVLLAWQGCLLLGAREIGGLKRVRVYLQFPLLWETEP